MACQREVDLRAGLVSDWQLLFPGRLPKEKPGQDALRDDLLQRWDEPHRHYHNLHHLAECLSALHDLGGVRAEQLAVWYHDAIYDGVPEQDERRSAALARDHLARAGEDPELVDEVERLVLLTIEHDPEPGDESGERLNDADLAILGSDPQRYAESVAAIRREYAHLDDEQWRVGRRQVLQTFLTRPQLFRTHLGRDRWEARARHNIGRELVRL